MVQAATTLQALQNRVSQLKLDKEYKQDQIQQINASLQAARAEMSAAVQAVKDAAAALAAGD